jgi:hypothetical protein
MLQVAITVQWWATSGRILRFHRFRLLLTTKRDGAARLRTAEIHIVREHVSTQITVAAELLATIRTVVRFDVRVSEQMGLEIGALVEAASTSGTLVWGVVHVQNAMHCECARLTESLATGLTLEWFLF